MPGWSSPLPGASGSRKSSALTAEPPDDNELARFWGWRRSTCRRRRRAGSARSPTGRQRTRRSL
eukprot:7342617-Prymnesium_polylepis.1